MAKREYRAGLYLALDTAWCCGLGRGVYVEGSFGKHQFSLPDFVRTSMYDFDDQAAVFSNGPYLVGPLPQHQISVIPSQTSLSFLTKSLLEGQNVSELKCKHSLNKNGLGFLCCE